MERPQTQTQTLTETSESPQTYPPFSHRSQFQNTFFISPHPRAPLLSNNPDLANNILLDIGKELSSRNCKLNDESRQLVLELGFTSLWFFMKYIAGYSGPFHKLNTNLHLEMCNFRQSPLCMNQGVRFGKIMPRGHGKTTNVQGACSWEAFRFPDIRIILAGATTDKMRRNTRTIRLVFEDNDLLREIAPEYCPAPNQPRWNESEFVMPNRRRNHTIATVTPMGATGSTEGPHGHLLICDDIHGLADMTSNMISSADMISKKLWFNTSIRALLDSPKRGRVGLVGTLFAGDDVNHQVMYGAKTIIGYKEHFKENPDGRWNVYYRTNIENGEPILPEDFSLKEYEEMKKDDPMAYYMGYVNFPQKAGLTEFAKFNFKKCTVEKKEETSTIEIITRGTTNFPTEHDNKRIPLHDLDCVIAVDFAGTERGITSKTNKTSIGVVGMDYLGFVYLLYVKTGYFNLRQTIDYTFEAYELFYRYPRSTILEDNGLQKQFINTYYEEEEERKIYLNIDPQTATTDKVVRIRTTVGNKLMAGKIYVAEGFEKEITEEKDLFPQAPSRRDNLDMLEKGIQGCIKPIDPDRDWDSVRDQYIEDMADVPDYFTRNSTGY